MKRWSSTRSTIILNPLHSKRWATDHHSTLVTVLIGTDTLHSGLQFSGIQITLFVDRGFKLAGFSRRFHRCRGIQRPEHQIPKKPCSSRRTASFRRPRRIYNLVQTESARFNGIPGLPRSATMFLPLPVHLLHRHFRIDTLPENTQQAGATLAPASAAINR